MIRTTLRGIALVAVLAAAGVGFGADYPGVVIRSPKLGEYVYWITSAQAVEGEKPAQQPFFLSRVPVYKEGKAQEYLAWPTYFESEQVEVPLKGVESPTPAASPKQGAKPAKPEAEQKVVAPSVVVGLCDIDGNVCGEKLVKLDPEAAVEVVFAKEDLDHVAHLVVEVGTLKAGTLTLESGDWRSQLTIVPDDGGKADFFFVPLGQAKAMLRYGKDKSKSLAFEIRRPEEGKVQTVSLIPAGYERKPAEEGEKPKAAGGEKKGEKEGASAGSFIRAMLVAIVVLAIIGYVVFIILKSKNITLQKALGKLGVTDIPQPQQDTQGGAAPAKPLVPEGVCEFCGQKRDAAGNCACTVAGGVVSAPVTGAAIGIAAAAKLVGTLGPAMNQVFLLADTTTVGREPDNTIAMTQDTTASRHHARIEKKQEGYVISDLGSSNGTYVNGTRIAQQVLKVGDEVRIGSSGFRFDIS